jgi:colicin import membrane protein
MAVNPVSGMGAAALAHGALLPRQPGGLAPGAALALLVHLGLIAALTVSVDWRAKPPEVISAELWAAVPQSAAPPPPLPAPVAAPVPAPAPAPAPVPAPVPAPPPPAPAPAPAPDPIPEADIALERRKAEQLQKKKEAKEQADRERREQEKREQAKREREAEIKAEAERVAKAEKAKSEKAEKAEKAKAERLKAEKAEKAAAEKEASEAKAEADRLARQREENLKRMMGQAGNAAGRTGTAARDAAPSASYAGAVAARIRRELVFTGDVPESAVAEVLISVGPSGTIIGREITKKSGYKEWDDAVLRAIDKTAALPRDTDGRVPASMTLVFKRRE